MDDRFAPQPIARWYMAAAIVSFLQSREEFGAYWRGEHVAIARHVPGLRRYVQNHFLPESIQGEPPCDGVAELWFDSAEAFQQALVHRHS